MRTEALIHWLSATIPQEANGIGGSLELAKQAVPIADRAWIAVHALHGYRWAVATFDGIRVQCGDVRMGVHVELPGETLQGLRKEGIAPEGIISALVRMGANFARLDLSIDIFDSQLSIYSLEDQFNAGRCTTSARYAKLQRSNDGGVTLYVGHPQSDRQLRVYNKAAERRAKGVKPDEEEWIRVELQLRKKAAHTAAHVIAATAETPRIIRSMIVGFADWPDDRVWVIAMRHIPVVLGASKKHRGNTDQWIFSACATAIARRIVQEPAFRAEWERALAAAIAQFSTNEHVD